MEKSPRQQVMLKGMLNFVESENEDVNKKLKEIKKVERV